MGLEVTGLDVGELVTPVLKQRKRASINNKNIKKEKSKNETDKRCKLDQSRLHSNGRAARRRSQGFCSWSRGRR